MKRALILLLLAACKPAGATSTAPKAAATLSKEGDLVVVTLSEEAEKRLGVKTAAVERRKLDRVRELGADVVVPPGAAVAVAAPLAGTLSGEIPRAGSAVTKGQALFTLTPFLSPESRASLAVSQVEAEGAVKVGKVAVDAAKAELARAEKLFEEKAGARRAVEEAGARKASADASLAAAVARRDLLAAAVGGTLGAVSVAAPFAGTLWKIHAAPGQQVGAAAPLFEVANLDVLWLRVPVYVGDLAGIDVQRALKVEGRSAKPVAAPPAADPAQATADLVYEIENTPATLRPGQKLTVALPLRGAEEVATLPAGAILYDLQGGTWVYERIGPLKYARRRVRVSRVDGGVAALEGAGPGGALVVEGAAELFGTEFYVNK